MRYLIKILSALLSLSVIAPAQQKEAAGPPQQQPAIDPTGNLLMRSIMQKPSPKSDEMGESKPVVASPDPSIPSMTTNIVVIGDAAYIVIGDKLVPMIGGGASGCFDSNGEQTQAKIEKAQDQWSNLRNKK
ncbi:MAG: hypothetical protein L0220_06580 [Acidobacteria bacterium]|nr:hypothetical protein [Acidobacteriota bacterium]